MSSMMRDYLQLASPYRLHFIYASIFVSIPSALLYIAQIGTILRHRNFHNSFYFLFIARAIPDLFYLFNSFYGYRLPTVFGNFLLPFYRQLPNWAMALYHFLGSYTFQADNLAMAFLLLNRLTAIVWPFGQEKIWRRLLPFALLLIFLLPIFPTFDAFSMAASLNISENEPNSPNRTSFHIFEQSNEGYLDKSSLINAVFASLFLLICLAINIGTLIVFKVRKNALPKNHTIGAAGKGPVDGVESKLLLYALLTFLGHVAIALLTILIWFYSREDDSMALASLYAKYPLIVDICTILMPSGLLLWASPSFRQQWAKDWIPCRFFQNKNNTKPKASPNLVIVSPKGNLLGGAIRPPAPSTMSSGAAFLQPPASSSSYRFSSARQLGQQPKRQRGSSIVTVS